MQVKLSRNWFAPDGTLYKVSDNPHTFADDWADALSPSAKVIGAEKAEALEEEPKAVVKK